LLINTSYTDLGATAMDNKDGNITAKIIRTSAVDSSKVGTYLISYVVSDMAGNKDSITRTVVVYQLTSINENELTYALVNVFPNPAKDIINVSASGFQTLPLTISIVDLSGRTLSSKTFTTNTVNYSFNTTELNSGVYFL
jgi:hypothetical protein